MNIMIVIQQMCVMLILILTGCFLFRKNRLSEESAGHISGLVVNICNPAALICSAFDEGPRLSVPELAFSFGVMLLLYLVLIAAGSLFPLLLGIKKEKRYLYHLLTVYGNVGFLGIPLVTAVLGNSALIYVSINNLIYNLLFYTSGLSILRRKAGLKGGNGLRDTLSGFVNIGTVSALLTIVLYIIDPPVPAVLSETVTYAGRCTTLLSMLVLGVSVARLPIREIFSHKKDYLFLALRLVLLPVGCVVCLRPFLSNPLLAGTCALLLAAPCGNLPLMCSKQFRLETDTLARTIVLATLLSVLTIPIVVMFL